MKCFKCLSDVNEKEALECCGLHCACFLEWFGLSKVQPFCNLERRSLPSSGPELEERWKSSFFQGKYRKYSANLGKDSYIIKLKHASLPELPEVEYLSNQIAMVLNIPVPPFYFIKLFDEHAFVTKNFLANSSVEANLVHIYHYIKGKDSYNCENLLKVIGGNALSVMGSFIDISNFIELCLYDSLIGNHDRHGRNLAFFVTSSRRRQRLSPFYDNVSELALESGFLQADLNPTGSIVVKSTKNPTAKDYVNEFKRLDYQFVVEEFVKKINIKKICDVIDNSFCSDVMKKAIKKLVLKRYQEMCDAL